MSCRFCLDSGRHLHGTTSELDSCITFSVGLPAYIQWPLESRKQVLSIECGFCWPLRYHLIHNAPISYFFCFYFYFFSEIFSSIASIYLLYNSPKLLTHSLSSSPFSETRKSRRVSDSQGQDRRQDRLPDQDPGQKQEGPCWNHRGSGFEDDEDALLGESERSKVLLQPLLHC